MIISMPWLPVFLLQAPSMLVSLAGYMMATRFEAIVEGDDEARCRAAGEEALNEVEATEGLLSAFRPSSDIAHLNAAGGMWTRVDPRTFLLLRRCADLSAATEGAFDITVGPLLAAWGFHGGGGALPEEGVVSQAMALCGWHHMRFDDDATAVSLTPGARLDMGAVGKGYAIDAALNDLRDIGISSALLHGGTSTAAALGGPFDIEIARPGSDDAVGFAALTDGIALSVSAPHGKSFTGADGTTYGHVLDPRTGRPVASGRLAAVCAPTATWADALSTALLVLGESGIPLLAERFPDVSLLFLPAEGSAVTSGPAFHITGR